MIQKRHKEMKNEVGRLVRPEKEKKDTQKRVFFFLSR